MFLKYLMEFFGQGFSPSQNLLRTHASDKNQAQSDGSSVAVLLLVQEVIISRKCIKFNLDLILGKQICAVFYEQGHEIQVP